MAKLNAFKDETTNDVTELTVQKEEVKPEIKETELEKVVEQQELNVSNNIETPEQTVKEPEKDPFDTLDEFKEEWKKFETKDNDFNNVIDEQIIINKTIIQ